MSQRNPTTSPSPNPAWQTLDEFTLPNELDSERLALLKVTEAVRDLRLPAAHLERLKTAVAEATLNAIEHGNRLRPDLPVLIRVQVSEKALRVCVTDQGKNGPFPKPEAPNLEAKLSGQQALRGWGFFLIEKMIDSLRVTGDKAQYTIELFLYLEGGIDDQKNF